LKKNRGLRNDSGFFGAESGGIFVIRHLIRSGNCVIFPGGPARSPDETQPEKKGIRQMKKIVLIAMLLSGGLSILAAGDIELPKPRTDRGMPLMAALEQRRSTRAFAAKALPVEVVSDLLWAANGFNRPERGLRTAPSAMNAQEIELYVIFEQGAYFYEAAGHRLKPVVAEDLREIAGRQDFARTAPLTLVYVADYSRQTRISDPVRRKFYAGTDAGFIGQNVYLFCASEGLATVFRGAIDAGKLGEKLKIGENREVLYAQSVGYPAEPER
jgi:SagB-type dehydrogenase family enzyme